MLAWQQATNLGWYYGDPLAQAVANGSKDITGFKFVAPTGYNLQSVTNGGNFGALTTLLISNYPTSRSPTRTPTIRSSKSTGRSRSAGNLSLFGFISLGSFSQGAYGSKYERGADNSTFTVTFSASPQVITLPSLMQQAYVIGGAVLKPGVTPGNGPSLARKPGGGLVALLTPLASAGGPYPRTEHPRSRPAFPSCAVESPPPHRAVRGIFPSLPMRLLRYPRKPGSPSPETYHETRVDNIPREIIHSCVRKSLSSVPATSAQLRPIGSPPRNSPTSFCSTSSRAFPRAKPWTCWKPCPSRSATSASSAPTTMPIPPTPTWSSITAGIARKPGMSREDIA